MADRTVIFQDSNGSLKGVSSTADNILCNGIQFGADVTLARGAANRIDLASGDNLRIENGWVYGQKFQVDPDDGATATVGGNVLIYTGAGGAAGGGSPGGASGDFTLTLGAAGAGGTGAPAESAGVGGQIVLTAGTGGAGNVAPNAHAGNLGGLAWLKAGVGGAGTAVTAAGGGGSSYVTAGDAGANAGGGGAVGGSLYLNAGQGTGAFAGGSTYLRAGYHASSKGSIYIGDAYTGAIYISSTLDNPVVRIDSQTGALVFSNSADVQLSRNSADRLDLATGDSFNIVNGNLLFANVVTIDSGRHATFASDATDPGVNVGSVAGDPSSLSNGDIWYNSSTGKFRGYQNGAATDLISGGGVTGWSYSSPETYLTTSGDEVTVGGLGGTLGKFTIRGDTTTQICQVIRTVASQTADVITTQNSAGTNQVRLTISNEFIPATDNTGSVGTNGNRWALIRGTVVTSGDLNLENDDGSAAWTIREMPDFLLAINRNTGKKFKIALEPIDD